MGQLKVRVTGRHVDVGEALRGKIESDLQAGIGRYVTRDGEAVVTLGRQRHLYLVECHVHLDSGITLESHGQASEPHAAFALALEKVEKRARRYKRRLKDHHADQKAPFPRETVQAFVLEGPSDDEADSADGLPEAGDGAAPGGAIIAETTALLRTMPVAAAVTQLEVSDSPVVLFRNPVSGGLNLVYRRPDGNIGWIDPGRGVSG